jgi:hypothetical protein
MLLIRKQPRVATNDKKLQKVCLYKMFTHHKCTPFILMRHMAPSRKGMANQNTV